MRRKSALSNYYATPSQKEFKSIIERRKVNRLPHSMQIFILAGFAIYQALGDISKCIEVFPHATAKTLVAAGKHKTKYNQA
jgi:hypothetical protein